jgi:hypothetical protein
MNILTVALLFFGAVILGDTWIRPATDNWNCLRALVWVQVHTASLLIISFLGEA